MDIEYIAGFFDGEGSISLPKNNLCKDTGVQIANTNRPILEKIKETLGCGFVHKSRGARKPEWAPCFIFSVRKRRDVIEVLQKMLPHLEIKREAGQKLLDFLLSKPISYTEWSPEENAFLRENYGKNPTSDIIRKLRRSMSSVHAHAKDLGLSKHVEMRRWIPEEDKFAKKNYDKMTYKEIAKKLNRTLDSVASRLNKKLGLTKFKHPPHRPWDDDEIGFVRKNHGKMAKREIARQLNRSPSSVQSKVRALEYANQMREPYTQYPGGY